jgi:uncharacterized protein YbjT (DUF2867 family)
MSDKKKITVFGATGAQGGGLAWALLEEASDEFALRAVTRDAGSYRARALVEAGAEVVEADLDDPTSLDPALAGSWGAFFVTNYWEHLTPQREIDQARALAEAASRASLSHVVWSTLEDTRNWVPLSDDRLPTLQDNYKVPHFDTKGSANSFFIELGVPTTFLLTSFYWENLIHFGMGPQRDDNGRLVLHLPMADKKLPGIAVGDIGRCALGIFRASPAFVGETVGIAGEHLTGEEMAIALGTALDEEVAYNAVPFDVYRSFDFPGADDLGNMFQFKAEFEEYFCGVRDLAVARSLNPKLKTFADWLAENRDKIVAA